MVEKAAIRLEAENVRKRFGGVEALADVSLRLRAGTVHALFGVNGAGKSTLVKIITGVHPPDAGSIRLNGEPVEFRSSAEARDAGIAVVFQDPPLFPHLTVAENMVVGAYPTTPRGLVDGRGYTRSAEEVLARLNIALDPSALVQDLSVAEREFVAIARALQQSSEVLILDEPTAALTPDETRRLFDVLREYRAHNGTVLFITHRLQEAMEIADEATIIRNGRTVFAGAMSELTRSRIIEEMLGRELERELATARPADDARETGAPVLSIRDLSAAGAFSRVSLDVHAGEIVALAGLVGAGRSELVETIVGLRRESAGVIELDGVSARRRSPGRMARRGAVLVPEDRDTAGLVYGFSVAENIAMPNRAGVSRAGLLRRRAEARLAEQAVDMLEIRTESVAADVASLSGGNRQKVVLAKWLARSPRLLLLDEPTKGVDVGAKVEIHNVMRELARVRHVGILMVTSDFEEVVGLADRVLVMRQGQIVGELAGEAITEERILSLASTAPAEGDDQATATLRTA